MTSLALPRLSQLAGLLAMAATLVCTAARADDVFSDNFTRDYKPVEKLAELADNSTMGGYPIFRGGRTWRVVAGSSTENNIRVRLGSLTAISPIGNAFFAEAHTLVNLSQANAYFLAEPCKGSHLIAVNLGGRQFDNCMTIDTVFSAVGKESQTLLDIRVRNSQNGSRIYGLELFLSLNQLGFPGSQPSDWTEQSLAADPVKKEFIAKLSAWAQKLQTGVNLAIGYDKPQDAFAAVPPLADVLALAPKTAP